MRNFQENKAESRIVRRSDVRVKVTSGSANDNYHTMRPFVSTLKRSDARGVAAGMGTGLKPTGEVAAGAFAVGAGAPPAASNALLSVSQCRSLETSTFSELARPDLVTRKRSRQNERNLARSYFIRAAGCAHRAGASHVSLPSSPKPLWTMLSSCPSSASKLAEQLMCVVSLSSSSPHRSRSSSSAMLRRLHREGSALRWRMQNAMRPTAPRISPEAQLS